MNRAEQTARINRGVAGAWRRALTLVELLAVLSIMGLLVSLVPTALDSISGTWRLRGAAHTITATVQRAQSAAVSRNAPVGVHYDPRENAIWVGDERRHRGFRVLPEGVDLTWVKFNDRTIRTQVARCSAFPDGTLQPHMVKLSTEEGGNLLVGFDRLCGEPTYYTEKRP